MAALADFAPHADARAMSLVAEAARNELTLARWYRPAIAEGMSAGKVAASPLAENARIYWLRSRTLLASMTAGMRPQELVADLGRLGSVADLPQLARPVASTLMAADARFHGRQPMRAPFYGLPA